MARAQEMPLSHRHHTADPALALAAHCGPGEHSPHPPPTERSPWRRVSPQSPVSPDPRRKALLMDGEQLLGARIPLSSGCDPVSSEALPSKRSTLQAPPRTPPQADQRCPRVGGRGLRTEALPTPVGQPGRRHCGHGPFDSGPSGHLSPPRERGCCENRAGAEMGLRLAWESGHPAAPGTGLPGPPPTLPSAAPQEGLGHRHQASPVKDGGRERGGGCRAGRGLEAGRGRSRGSARGGLTSPRVASVRSPP